MITSSRFLALTLLAGALAACGTQIGPGDTGNNGNDAATDNGPGNDVANDNPIIVCGDCDGGLLPPDVQSMQDVPPPQDEDVFLRDVSTSEVAQIDVQPMQDVPPPRDVQLRDVQTDAPPFPQRGGLISLQTQDFMGSTQTYASATFYDDFNQIVPPGCAQRTVGNCVVIDCSGTTSPDAGTPQLYSAGDLTIRSAGLGDVVMVPGAGNMYSQFNDPTAYWPGGAMVDVSAPGAMVPAFDIPFVFPTAPNFTDPPSVGGMASVVIDRTQPFGLAWDPVGNNVEVLIAQQNGSALQAEILCAFPGADGSDAISPNVLSVLAPSPAGSSTQTVFVMGGAATPVTSVGGFDIEVLALRLNVFGTAQVR